MTYWQVFNAYGRMYLAGGDSAEEAIENARPLFASAYIRRSWEWSQTRRTPRSG